MIEEARKIVETIKEAFEVLSAMELPAEEQKIEITRDAAMTLIAQLEHAEPVRHSGCALCDIKETGHGIIVYPDIRWITAINKQDGNYYMVFCHEGETAKMQIAYCPVCGAKMDAGA